MIITSSLRRQDGKTERRKMERRKDGETERRKDGKTERRKDGKMEGWKDREMERQKDGKTERGKDGKIEKQKDGKTQKHKLERLKALPENHPSFLLPYNEQPIKHETILSMLHRRSYEVCIHCRYTLGT